MSMSRHERCWAAIRGQTVDQPPTYLPTIACEVASQILGRPAHTGTGSLHFAEVAAWADGDAAHADFEARMLQDVHDVYRALNVDVLRMPWRMNARPTRRIDQYTFLFGDEAGDYSILRYSPSGADFCTIERVLREPPTAEDRLRAFVEREERDPSRMIASAESSMAAHAADWHRLGSEFFVAAVAGAISAGFGEEAMILLATEPDLVARRVMLMAEQAIAQARSLLKSGAPGVMLGGGDLAGSTGPMYSPATFRAVTLPAYRHAMRALRDMGVHYAFRSDGNLWSLADMLFTDAACPGYGEADSDAGMTLELLRQRYPQLVIWGNVSSAFLAHATPQQVRDHCRRLADQSGGTRYFQGPSNAIVQGTPAENVLALFNVP